MSIRLVLPGKTIVSTGQSVTTPYHSVETLSAKVIEVATRGGPEPTEEVDCAADDVLELTFADGARQWISAAQFREDLRQTDPTALTERGLRVPSLLAGETAERGIGGLALKALKLLKIDPADAAATLATKAIIAKFETKAIPDSGLFVFPTPDRLGLPAKALSPAAPLLIFLHGTMSSSTGSFGKLANTAEWTRLRDRYGDRILAFEHATLSKSPIRNAIDLATDLPKGATLHLVSHSRGGLIGELLSLKPDQDVDVLQSIFKGRPEDADDIAELMRVLKKQRFGVKRFVRVACPARGTTLASKRLDLYLSALMNLIEFVPLARDSMVVDFLRAVTLETVKRRTDPAELPGIEAMMPDSPLIRMLNTVAKSDGDLAVIAGDAEGRGVLGRLKNLAIDAFFLAKNDFVVNTEAMYGGIPRNGKPARPPHVFDRGPAVNHFSYFSNEKTRKAIADRLEMDDATQAGFERGLVPAFIADFVRPLAANAPTVFLLPGIMGSHISIDDDRLWLDPASIAKGGMKTMTRISKGGADGILNSFYGALSSYLRVSHEMDVVEFGYDWRNSLETAAALLATAVSKRLDQRSAPVYFLAHSMGGLLARTMMANHRAVWQRMTERGGRLLMLGTPNNGSYAPAVTLAGHNSLVGMLGKVDLNHGEKELRGFIREFPGLIELLTEDLFDLANWLNHTDVIRPDPALLKKAKAVREKIQDAIDPNAMVYVAGSGATVDGWSIKEDVGNTVLREQSKRTAAIDFTATQGTVTFDRNGRASTAGGPMTFTIVPGYTISDPQDSMKRCIRLDASGRPKSNQGACV